MHFDSELLPRFNLASMAGVYPGARTDQFYRLRLWPKTEPEPKLYWYQLQYTAEPDGTVRFVVRRYEPTGQSAAEKTRDKAKRGAGTATDLTDAATPLPAEVAGELPDSAALHTQLHADLAAAGLSLHACGTCRHWQPYATETTAPPTTDTPTIDTPTIDTPRTDASNPVARATGRPQMGRCGWSASSADTNQEPQQPAWPAPATDLTATPVDQSALAPGCAHWEAQTSPPEPVETPVGAAPPPTPPTAPLGRWARLRASIVKLLTGKYSPNDPPPHPQSGERSGISAGTEPCFTCDGRLANLGALVVESDEGDPLTYSVWRCRECRTTYLNRWADRWVRTENLETDETHFRIAPIEAAHALAFIRSHRGGDHPQGLHQRTAAGRLLEELTTTAHLISQQVKQGR